ncbi:MAG: DMT family transporter [Pikeienuella sp.]
MIDPHNNPVRGILFMLAAMIIFSAQDGLSKYLAQSFSPVFITMIRYWFFGLVVVAILCRKGFRAGLASGQPKLQIFRGILLAAEIGVALLSFHLLGLSHTHAIFAFTPLLVVALSGPFLGEKIGWRRWSAVGVGLIGMMLIIRPGMVTLTAGFGVAVLAMVMFAIYAIATRRAARTDSAMTSFYYTGLVGAIAMTLVGPWFASPVTFSQALLLLTLCISGMTGHFLFIKAYDAAEAATLQPFAYLQTVFASLIGVMMFAESLAWQTALGAAIVICAGLFAFWRERVRAKLDSEKNQTA